MEFPTIPTDADDNARPPYDQMLVDIAAYVFHERIASPAAFQAARIALLDALSCAVETLKWSPEAKKIIGPIVPDTTVPCGFKLPGTKFRLDPLKGAFDLASLIRYRDYNDEFPGADLGHPSNNIGAILSVADWRGRTLRASNSKDQITMEIVLCAIIKAYEIQGCLELRDASNDVGLDHTLLVKIASTAVVSWLLGSTEAQTIDALSHAFMDGAPLRAFRHSPNTGPRQGWAAGDACMRAVHLAMLTKSGQPGAPTVLSDPSWGFDKTLFKDNRLQLIKPLKSRVIEDVFYIIHTVEGQGASAIQAALKIGFQLRIRGLSIERDIAHIRVRTQRAAMLMINKQGPLHSSDDREHCMQYMIAVTLLKRAVIEVDDFQDSSSWAKDERVEVLRKKIELVEDTQFTADYTEINNRRASSAIKVSINDGSDIALVDDPVFFPWRVRTADLMNEKFVRNTQNWFGEGPWTIRIHGLVDMDHKEFRKMNVCDFVDLWATWHK